MIASAWSVVLAASVYSVVGVVILAIGFFLGCAFTLKDVRELTPEEEALLDATGGPL